MNLRKQPLLIFSFIGGLATFAPWSAADTLDPVAANPTQGQQIFMQCMVCPAIETSRADKIGQRPWDYERLYRFQQNPPALAPQPNMSFAGLKDSPLPEATGEPLAPVVESDAYAGLPEGPGREKVFYTCQVCHSLKMVTQQRLSRDVWDETLDWMVKEQGMDALDALTRTLILDYLATHFGVPR